MPNRTIPQHVINGIKEFKKTDARGQYYFVFIDEHETKDEYTLDTILKANKAGHLKILYSLGGCSITQKTGAYYFGFTQGDALKAAQLLKKPLYNENGQKVPKRAAKPPKPPKR